MWFEAFSLLFSYYSYSFTKIWHLFVYECLPMVLSLFFYVFKNHNCFFPSNHFIQNDQTHCAVILCEILELIVFHWWGIGKNWTHQSISWGQNMFEFKKYIFLLYRNMVHWIVTLKPGRISTPFNNSETMINGKAFYNGKSEHICHNLRFIRMWL